MKEISRAAERIMHELLPNLANMLERPIRRDNELSEYYYGRQVLEQVEVEFRAAKRNQTVLKDRVQEL